MSTGGQHYRSALQYGGWLRRLLSGIRWVVLGGVRRTLFVLLLVVAVGLLIDEIVHYRDLFAEERQEEYETNLEVARFAATTFNGFGRFVLYEEQELGGYFLRSQTSPVDRANALLAAGVAELPAVRYYAFVNPQGRVVASTDPGTVGSELGAASALGEIVQGREWVVTDLFRAVPGDQVTFIIARGVRDERGVLQGIIATAVDPDYLGQVVSVQRAEEGTVVIIDGNGMLVYVYPEAKLSWEERNLLPSEPLLIQALAGEEATGSFVSRIDGMERMAGYAPIPEIGWAARASRPTAAVVAPILDSLYREAATDSVVLIAALLAAFVISRNITVPLRRLQEHASAIGRGEFDPALKVAGPIELETLADAFNRMSEEIRTREGQLRQANESLRIFDLVVSNSPLPILVVDKQYVLTRVNPAYAKFRGQRIDQIIGLTAADVTSKEYFEGLVRPSLERCFAGKSDRYETWITYPPPVGRRYVEVSYFPLLSDGEVDYAVVVLHDRTEAKQVEEAVSRLAAIVESSEDAVIALSLDGTIQTWNPGAERLYGYTADEVRGRLWSIVVPPERSGELERNLEHMARGERIEPYDTVRMAKDGRRIDVSLGWSPLRDAEGGISGASIIARDITRRKRAETEREQLLAEIQRRAAELDTTITSIADGVVIYGPTGEIVRMNGAAEYFLGFTPAERGLSLAERMARLRAETADGKPFSPEQHPVYRAIHGEAVSGVVIVAHQPQASFWLSVSAAPIRAPDGRQLGAVSVITDITAQHQLQEWLQDLIRMVSHDLRNPLLVIQGQAQMLLRMLDRAGLTGNERRSAEAIVTGARRMNAMIQDLIDSARLESGQFLLQRQPVGLKSCLSDLLERARGSMDISRIKVEMPDDLPSVLSDTDRLERILTNLLTNALKYSAPQTEVVVRAARTDDKVIVSIIDRGVGIAPEDMAHLFERFYRTRGARKVEGLGLGLYITRMMVEAHGGRIWAESEPAKGSTFYFTLPVA